MGTGGRPYRPPVGIPAPRENRLRGVVVSVLVHALIVALLLIPAVAAVIVHVNRQTAGAAGQRGGGGGGWGQHLQESLHFMTSPAPTPTQTPPLKPPPTPPPKPPPAESPPVPETTKVSEVPNEVGAGQEAPQGREQGQGRGQEGQGQGPGTGGGTGPGRGTGTGNGTGPGTGGTGGTKIHAQTDFFAIPAGVAPTRPRPFHLHAIFAVTVHGDATLLSVNKADDGDFNRQIRDALMETHFKPATLPDGTPVADTVPIDIDY